MAVQGALPFAFALRSQEKSIFQQLISESQYTDFPSVEPSAGSFAYMAVLDGSYSPHPLSRALPCPVVERFKAYSFLNSGQSPLLESAGRTICQLRVEEDSLRFGTSLGHNV